MKAKLFRADPHYLDMLHSFTVHDTLMALGYYLVILIVYYCAGSIMARTGSFNSVWYVHSVRFVNTWAGHRPLQEAM